MDKLSEIVKVNDDFRNAININLNINKIDKINAYIPTKASSKILLEMTESIMCNKNQASLLIGSYGKGKSHLMLILLSVISLERNEENNLVIKNLAEKIEGINSDCANNILNIWNKKKKFLPIIINNSYTDMNQAFLIALNNALKKANLTNLKPITFFESAISNIKQWKSEYKNTFDLFMKELEHSNIDYNKFISSLKKYNNDSLQYFIDIYPKLTSGSSFSPMINQEIQKLYKDILCEIKKTDNYCGIYIIFDEFSKFIESKDKLSSGNDMKIIQDICELSNESKKDNQLFFTMIAHKSIKEYGDYLSKSTINSFLGIQGRINERHFISSPKNNYDLIKNAISKNEKNFKYLCKTSVFFRDNRINQYYEIPAFRINYESNDFINTVYKGCYPLNPISSYCLINVSEKVAQNERTLFTFISKNERNSMAHYILNNKTLDDENKTVNLDLIYDYFKNIFKEDSSNYYVHDIWLKAEYVLDKLKDKHLKSIIKAIAILKIVNNQAEIPVSEKNIELSLNRFNILSDLEKLCDNQYIKKRNDLSYDFITSNNKRLNKEIEIRAKKKTNIQMISTLNNISYLDYEYPKKYNNEEAITRFLKYEFIMDTDLLKINDVGVFFNENDIEDGKIMLVIKNDSRLNDIKGKIEELNENKLIFMYPNKKFKNIEIIRNIEILNDIRNDSAFMEANPVLAREIELNLNDYIESINDDIYELYDLYSGCRVLALSSEKVIQYSKCTLNSVVSSVCKDIYNHYPKINNELINKNRLSSSVKRAQKNIINVILNKKITDDMFCKTSAEDTIFRAIIRNTGIIENNCDENMKYVITVINNFFEACVENKNGIDNLVNKLINKPIGMRKGVIPVILAYTLRNIIKDVVIYRDETEIEANSDVLIDIVNKSGEYKLFISKDSDEKKNYLSSFVELFSLNNENNYYDTKTCVELLRKWYRSLPQITKNINDSEYYDEIINEKDLKKFKNIIIRDENPYELLFLKIPELFSSDYDYEFVIKKLYCLKSKMDGFYKYMNIYCLEGTFKVFNKKESLYNVLKEWYKKQSEKSKLNLYENEITGFMNYIENLSNFDEKETVKDIVKIITSNYFENWNNSSYENYISTLSDVKNKIELIKDIDSNENKKYFKYLDDENKEVVKFYNDVQDSQANILKNVLEGDLDDFYNLSTNDKAAILVEMLDKVLKG